MDNNVISDAWKDDKNHFRAFFNDFKEKQIHNMRPGVCLKVAEFIKSFCEDWNAHSAKITFESFLSDLVSVLSELLLTRKPAAHSTVTGRAANLSLLLSPSYDRLKTRSNLSSSTNHLEKHFYYLINPSNAMNWIFVTSPATQPNASCPLDIFQGNIRKNWKTELTFFKKEEILAILACMNFYNVEGEDEEFKSFSCLLDEIFEVCEGLLFDTGKTVNPVAKKRDWNRLEVLSTLCASHSSHFDPIEKRYSFRGQSGNKFFMNLVANLKISHPAPAPAIKFNYSRAKLRSFNIRKYLQEDVLIPFLYVSNCELPKIFIEIMTKSNIRNRSIKIAKITRTTDKSKIDIQFPFYLCFEKKINCKMECKNWQGNVYYGDLMEIFARAKSRNQRPIIITICDEIGGPKEDTLKEFTEYCSKNRINAYRFEQTSSCAFSFSLVPFSNYLSPNPSLIAFVIELKIINENKNENEI